MPNGSYNGLLVQFETDRPFQDVLNKTIENHRSVYHSLPGLSASMYYHINENQYCAVFSFEMEADVDQAIEILRPILETRIPVVKFTKADVLSGTQIPID